MSDRGLGVQWPRFEVKKEIPDETIPAGRIGVDGAGSGAKPSDGPTDCGGMRVLALGIQREGDKNDHTLQQLDPGKALVYVTCKRGRTTH